MAERCRRSGSARARCGACRDARARWRRAPRVPESGGPRARIWRCSGRSGCKGSRPHLMELRSEEHTSELQSLMRISYAVFCLKKKKHNNITEITHNTIDTISINEII